MKNERVYREVFVNNTIRIVASEGFEGATTRAIAGERGEVGQVKLNDVHIYRVFGTKEKLFAETFSMLDNELVATIESSLSDFEEGMAFGERCKVVFMDLWRFLLKNESKCRYYTRYYYSVYFKDDVYQAHMKKYERLMDLLTPSFVENADVWSLFHHVITVMLDFAIRVYSGAIEDTDNNAGHIFTVVYSSIAPYLRMKENCDIL